MGGPRRQRHQTLGKMLRPLLCLASCEAVGGDGQRALPAAAALELLHNFSLIHDDIEDGSPQRHGRDTVWRVWGVAQAVNAGDGMFALAHVTLHRLSEVGVAADQVLAVAALLDEASLRLCEGQYRDLSYEERLDVRCDDYLEMVAGKTAALMAASAARAHSSATLRRNGRALRGVWPEARDGLPGPRRHPGYLGRERRDREADGR